MKISPFHKIVYLKNKCYEHRNKNKIRYILFRVIYEHYQIKYGIQIPAQVKIGKDFSIGHWGGIVINAKAIIGDNVRIMNGILIGDEQRGKRQGSPIIGNKVWIGANACIVGKIKIGDNVLIAPNSFVNFDVPSDSIVLGNPAKIISRENATEGYIKRYTNNYNMN